MSLLAHSVTAFLARAAGPSVRRIDRAQSVLRIGIDSLSTYSAPQSSINVNLRKLAALGGKKKEGMILKVARLWLIVPMTCDSNSATLSGIIAGRRFYELVSNVQVSPAGWPVDYSHDCSGKALRQQHIMLHGHLACPDPLDMADNDYADAAKRLIIPINFWRDRAVRPEDFCAAAVHVGEGSMQFAIQGLQISGISDEKIASGCKVA